MDQNNQQLIKASVVIVIVTGLLGALSVVADGIGATSGKIFSLSLSLLLFGITAAISMVVTRKPEYKTLGTAGMIASGLGFLLLAIVILGGTDGGGLVQLAFALFITAIALAHICLLHNFNLQNKYAHYARMTATIAIAIFSLILITRIFEPLPSLYSLAGSQSVIKVIVAALIVDLAATLLVPLCNRLKVESPVEELSFTPEPPPVQNEQTPVE
jgi:hypothetical protein